MRTINSVMDELTNTEKLIEDMKATLRAIDTEFPAEEAQFNTAKKLFLEKVGDRFTPSASEYLKAHELDFVSSMIYIAGQGFKLNLDIFMNPANVLFLQQCEFEDLNRERMLATVPGVQKAWKTINAFSDMVRKLPEAEAEDIRSLTDGITSMYSYLETAGYKIAHYFGFVLADRFLPYVLPGYHRDDVNTMRYYREVKDYLKIDLDKLGRV